MAITLPPTPPKPKRKAAKAKPAADHPSPARARRVTRQSRVIVVANRLPVHRVGHGDAAHWERSPGGLVTAMEPVLRDHPGAWIGWTGAAGKAPRPFDSGGLSVHPVPLSEAELTDYYDGMCNRTFWPLYHDAIRTPDFQRSWWRSYQVVNQRFARAAAKVARKGDTVWVHDYQLQLVPRYLREMKPGLRIGFFLHIPFPPEELFAWLPWRQSVLQGMLGSDLVGFQTAESFRNFSRLARRYTGADGPDATLDYEGRPVHVGAFPISIDSDDFESLAQDPRVTAEARAVRRRLGADRKIILCVDRLDYTKGIDARLAAYAELLRRKEVTVDKCVLVQVAVPSRERVPQYDEMRTQVEQAVGRINGEFALPGAVAVHYFRRNLQREQLVAFYKAADVMLVSPLRDGMNLVAKEYVATRTDNTGVLLLSEFAGAAKELRQAVLINPRDVDGLAAAIRYALRMSKEEARRRMIVLRMQVRRHDVGYWAKCFLERMGV